MGGRRRLDPGLCVPGVVAGAPATGCNLIPQAHERLGRTERAAVKPPDGCCITDPDPKVGLCLSQAHLWVRVGYTTSIGWLHSRPLCPAKPFVGLRDQVASCGRCARNDSWDTQSRVEAAPAPH